MKKRNEKQKDSPEQVSADDARRRMRAFADRKEKFVAAVKKSKDRSVSPR
jgi:hypothetical protein